jgi:hypothetical protein
LVGASLEAIYLTHILQTLSRLQNTFDNGDTNTYSLYIEYLRNAVLDEKVCTEINNKMKTRKAELDSEGVDDGLQKFYLGFLVVREVMQYLNASLDLTHEDIIGRAYDLSKLEAEEAAMEAAEQEAQNDSPISKD